MARSPWNYLARLIGRGRKVQEASYTQFNAGTDGSGDRPDRVLLIPLVELEPAAERGPKSDRVPEGRSEAGDEPASTMRISAETVLNLSVLEPPAPLLQSVPEAVNQSKLVLKATPKATRVAKWATAGRPCVDAPVAVPAASDEFLLLDSEIQQLRWQLIEKLRSQNGQLKKMLARFDR